jgi:hemerythrin-like domain-containing protein
MKKTADPIAQLMQEHDDALLQLKVLNRAVNAFAEDGYSSKYFNQIGAAMKFIQEEVSVHNHKEEAALFPILERYVEGPTRIMRNDHKKLKKGFIQLRDAIKRVEKNRDSFSAIKQLKRIANSVVQLFVSHIHKENYIIFPLVQQFLSKDELREVARKMI